MKQVFGLHIKRDRAAGFAGALFLHSAVLYALWSYQIIPPPSEVLTVFVNYINPSSPAKIAEPAVSKPARPIPIRQETPRTVSPVATELLVSAAPVLSVAEPVAPPPPVVKALPEPAPVSSFEISGPVNEPAANAGGTAGAQPVLLTGELSVSCKERTAPAYPKQSLRLGEQGKTVLLVELDELGRVVNVAVKTKSGFPRLDEAAINAVKTWRCSPAERNGVAVRAVALQPFNFILKGR
jgi:protein TonB